MAPSCIGKQCWDLGNTQLWEMPKMAHFLRLASSFGPLSGQMRRGRSQASVAAVPSTPRSWTTHVWTYCERCVRIPVSLHRRAVRIARIQRRRALALEVQSIRRLPRRELGLRCVWRAGARRGGREAGTDGRDTQLNSVWVRIARTNRGGAWTCVRLERQDVSAAQARFLAQSKSPKFTF